MVWLNVLFVSPTWFGILCGLSLPDGLDECVACLYKMVRRCAVCLYKMVWMHYMSIYMYGFSLQNGLDIFGCLYEMFSIHVWLVSAAWFEYVWFVPAKCFG